MRCSWRLALATAVIASAATAQRASVSAAEGSVGAQHEEPEGASPLVELDPVFGTACTDGFAGPFPCADVDLLAFLPRRAIGAPAVALNDVWGWTDTASGREFALVGTEEGTAFVEVTDPRAPVFLGTLPTHTSRSSWRDIKVFADHAFVVSEARDHGMQVFDLRQLLALAEPPVTFQETAFYSGNELGSSHNIAINEQTGFAYAVGSRTCGRGLHMIDVRNPVQPSFAGCFAEDGYVHDAQCVVYQGLDGEHRGRELCFSSAEDTVTIVDVTDKAAPRVLSRSSYPGFAYVHQGWLTDDQAYYLSDDELDERSYGHPTRTYVFSLVDLEAPALVGVYQSSTPSTDHNQYVRGRFSYQANYRSGLRVLSLDRIDSARLVEVGYFDVAPESDAPGFSGAWSVYPYFPSGTVVVSGIEQGLFVLDPRND